MLTYVIELDADGHPRLIKNDGAGADSLFDGGRIYYQPEGYPATIVERAAGVIEYSETVVGDAEAWATYRATRNRSLSRAMAGRAV